MLGSSSKRCPHLRLRLRTCRSRIIAQNLYLWITSLKWTEIPVHRNTAPKRTDYTTQHTVLKLVFSGTCHGWSMHRMSQYTNTRIPSRLFYLMGLARIKHHHNTRTPASILSQAVEQAQKTTARQAFDVMAATYDVDVAPRNPDAIYMF